MTEKIMFGYIIHKFFFVDIRSVCYGLESGQWTERFRMNIQRRFASSTAMSNSEVHIIGGEKKSLQVKSQKSLKLEQLHLAFYLLAVSEVDLGTISPTIYTLFNTKVSPKTFLCLK
jgi:hypothetical protein